MMPHERWCIRSENGPCARVTWLWYSSIGLIARLPNSSSAANGPNTEESNTRVVFGIDGLPAVRAVFTGNQGVEEQPLCPKGHVRGGYGSITWAARAHRCRAAPGRAPPRGGRPPTGRPPCPSCRDRQVPAVDRCEGPVDRGRHRQQRAPATT